MVAATACPGCASGEFEYGDGTCASCPMGFFARDYGSQSCSACPLGRFADETGRAECKACPIARYGVYEYATSVEACAACSAGRYGETTAGTSVGKACLLCPAGYAQPARERAFCTQCPEGTFSEEAESVICTKCAAGRYSDKGPGQTSGNICTRASQGGTQRVVRVRRPRPSAPHALQASSPSRVLHKQVRLSAWHAPWGRSAPPE